MNFVAAADYSDGKSSQSKDASATKGIGAHLLQIQQSAMKSSAAKGGDLITLLRQIGYAVQLMSDYHCFDAIK